MSRTNIRALIALNALMLGLLGLVTFAPRAMAQGRVRGDFTMVAGNVNGADSSVVYIVDSPNQEMIAVMYNPNTKLIEGIGYRNLVADAAEVLRGRATSGN